MHFHRYIFSACVFYIILISLVSCNRPLFVTHWSGKGKALIKKKGYGWPNHGLFANFICMNKLCLNKAERTNMWSRKRFKGYKKNNPLHYRWEKTKIPHDSLHAEDQKIASNQNLILKTVRFASDSCHLPAASYEELDKLFDLLDHHQRMKLHITGHSDSSGIEVRNNELSLLRAKEVAGYLIIKGISSDRITCEGMGGKDPIAESNTESGRARNRRVEYKIQY